VLHFQIGSAPAYEVIVAGHTPEGRLGATREKILVSPPKTAAPAGAGVPNGVILPPNPVPPPPQPMP
jgi:hypothetical protein